MRREKRQKKTVGEEEMALPGGFVVVYADIVSGP